jgi:hypothetical protein
MKFTIRDLLWLTLLAAVLVAWWVDRRSYLPVQLPDGTWGIDRDGIFYHPVVMPDSAARDQNLTSD